MHTAVGNFEIGDLVCTTDGPFVQGLIVSWLENGDAAIQVGSKIVGVPVDHLTFVED